jgi:hypothetical protein
VGSIPFSSAEETFRQICKDLPGRIRRLPDGKTGDGGNFIRFQIPDFPPEILSPQVGLNKDINNDEVLRTLAKIPALLETHYDDHALSSYATFCTMRMNGEISAEYSLSGLAPHPADCHRVMHSPGVPSRCGTDIRGSHLARSQANPDRNSSARSCNPMGHARRDSSARKRHDQPMVCSSEGRHH